MIRFLGFLFSNGAIGAVAGIGLIAGVVWMYDRDLPDHEGLASYQPATLTRVYSGEGKVIAEFAKERRIFTPIDEMPDLVKHAFISAEDKNFYEHTGVDGLGVVNAMEGFGSVTASIPAKLPMIAEWAAALPAAI